MQYHSVKVIDILQVKLKNGAKPRKVLPKTAILSLALFLADTEKRGWVEKRGK